MAVHLALVHHAGLHDVEGGGRRGNGGAGQPPVEEAARILRGPRHRPGHRRRADLVHGPAEVRAAARGRRLMQKPTSVRQYLSWQDAGRRAALDRLREVIAAAAPDATEGISYSMPAFLLGGKGLVCYAAFKDHYSLFPMSGAVVEQYAAELGDRMTGKGTIQFRYGERLPVGLVKKIVKTRLAELERKLRG